MSRHDKIAKTLEMAGYTVTRRRIHGVFCWMIIKLDTQHEILQHDTSYMVQAT